jgi:hypothetical protein
MTATDENTNAEFFAQISRGYIDAVEVRFLNNGGRSKLMPVGVLNGAGEPARRIPLAPTLNQRIDDAIIAAAHTCARAIYGTRKNWPFRITITSAVVPADAN